MYFYIFLALFVCVSCDPCAPLPTCGADELEKCKIEKLEGQEQSAQCETEKELCEPQCEQGGV